MSTLLFLHFWSQWFFPGSHSRRPLALRKTCRSQRASAEWIKNILWLDSDISGFGHETGTFQIQTPCRKGQQQLQQNPFRRFSACAEQAWSVSAALQSLSLLHNTSHTVSTRCVRQIKMLPSNLVSFHLIWKLSLPNALLSFPWCDWKNNR